MATTVSYNGTNYTVPQSGDSGWGTTLTTYLVALASGSLTKAGGLMTLTAELDLGATYGIKSAYFSARGTPATAGAYRLENNTSISWRNAANDGNLNLTVNSSNALQFNSLPVAAIALGAANTVFKMNAGGTAFEYGTLVNANINASAAIAYSKLNLATSIVNADISASAAIDGSKLVAASASVAGAMTTGTQTIAGAKTFTGNFYIGANATALSGVTAMHTSTTASGAVQLTSVTDTSKGAWLYFTKSRGSIGSETIVSDDDEVGSIFFYALGAGASATHVASIRCYVDGEPGTASDTTDTPGRLVFCTSADGTSTATERMTLGSDGILVLNNGAKMDNDADQDALNYYRTEVVELTFTMNGASGASSTLNSTFTRIGNQVTVHFGLYRAATGTTSTAFVCSSGWPTWALPTSSVLWTGFNVRDNGASDTSNFGYIQITTAGVCNIGRNIAGTAWTNSATANSGGMNAITSVTYLV